MIKIKNILTLINNIPHLQNQTYFFYLVVLLISFIITPVTAYIIYTDSFENTIIKGEIDNITPFSTMNVGETWGSIYYENGKYYLFFSNMTDDNIYVRNSTDGKTWGNYTLILSKGNSGRWDDMAVYCPIVWKENNTYYMIYTGNSGDEVRVGLATSTSLMSDWSKYENNPVYENTGWDTEGSEPWGIYKFNDTYYLWVNSLGSTIRKLSLITSTDLHTWVDDQQNPIFDGMRFCPSIFKYNGYFYLTVVHQYTSGDYANIELYRDTSPTFHNNTRTYLGTILNTVRNTSSGYGQDLDTPTYVITGPLTSELTTTPLIFYYSVQNSYGWKMGMFSINPNTFSNGILLPEPYSSANEQTTDISLSSDTSVTGTKSLKFNVSSTSNLYYRIHPNVRNGNVSFWINQTDQSKSYFYATNDTDATIFILQIGGDNYRIKVFNGSTSYERVYNRTASTWYNVILGYNLSTGNWTYTLKDTFGTTLDEVSNLAIQNPASRQINSMYFYRTSTYKPPFYWDDLKIHDYVNSLNDTTPPSSIILLSNNTLTRGQITWSWTNPVDSDFSHIIVYKDGVWLKNTSSNTDTWTGLSLGGIHTFSSRTCDLSDNCNETWVNQSANATMLTSEKIANKVTDTQNVLFVGTYIAVIAIVASLVGTSLFGRK